MLGKISGASMRAKNWRAQRQDQVSGTSNGFANTPEEGRYQLIDGSAYEALANWKASEPASSQPDRHSAFSQPTPPSKMCSIFNAI
jgi:hypothetical protein